MNVITVDGLVVGETRLGDNKKYIRVLTNSVGIISVIVHGASSVKSKNMSAVKPYSFSSFTLTRRGESYTLKEASLKKSFFMLGSNPKKLALASYVMSVSEYVATEGDDCVELLSLALNTLYILCESDKPCELIKAAFELKCATVLGFAPSLVSCFSCGCELNGKEALFRVYEGNAVCLECKDKNTPLEYEITYKIGRDVICAMQYITYSSVKKIFSFNLDCVGLSLLSEIAEKYLLSRVETAFPALKIYKSMNY